MKAQNEQANDIKIRRQYRSETFFDNHLLFIHIKKNSFSFCVSSLLFSSLLAIVVATA